MDSRDFLRELVKQAKIAPAVDGKTIKGLILESLYGKVQELEKKGLLPKGKNSHNGKDGRVSGIHN